ncbi:MAG: ferric reductase-like transmembrane domain-containing protein [Thalassobaculum sp.]|uniref:sulfite oxidase heme-binding subunit YedZ n=1 Tax=Thalassobaculum sp. TaxID=2022740 RepID=UPI0032EB7659
MSTATETMRAGPEPAGRRPAAARPLRRWLPWTDGAGRLSPLKLVAFLALLVPAALLAVDALAGDLGPRPWDLAIHRVGWWTVLFLMASLTVTPLRRTLRWNGLVAVRRMIGVTVFLAAALHLVLYAGERAWDLWKVSSEIVLRFYLTIGLAALLGLAALAATSTDGMVRRLGGKRWQVLHRLVYPIAVLALVHFFLQTKADVTQPILFSGLFVWLMAYRLWRSRLGDPSVGGLVGLAVVAAVLTAAGEVAGISMAFHAPPSVIAAAHFDLDIGVRPAWWVLAAGLAVAAGALARRHGPLARR